MMFDEKHNIDNLTLSIPKPLTKKIVEQMKKSDFTSVSSYVIYLIREIISSKDEEERTKKAFTDEEENYVKERLRNLGYID